MKIPINLFTSTHRCATITARRFKLQLHYLTVLRFANEMVYALCDEMPLSAKRSILVANIVNVA